MNYEIKENILTVGDYIRLIESVGWSHDAEAILDAALRRSIVTAALVLDGEIVGMGRMVGDGVVMCYIQDVIVMPEYQRKGFGSAIVKYLLNYIKKHGMNGATVNVDLFTSKDRAGFYEKLGFTKRPYDDNGAGMHQFIKIDEGDYI